MRFHNRLPAFARQNNGAVGMIFALSILPIMALTAMAVDYAALMRGKAEGMSMADSAVLAAISQASGTVDQPVHVALPRAKDMAEKEFKSLYAANAPDWTLGSLEISTEEVSRGIEVKLCFTGTRKLIGFGVAGVQAMPFSGCTSAQSAPPVYVKVFALVDASGSMGIGASHADQTLMQNRLGCAFACHTISDAFDNFCMANTSANLRNWWYQTPKCAKVIGAKTRFDIVREALMKVTDQARELSRVPNQYQLTVHKFSNYLTQVTHSPTNLAMTKSLLGAMTMDKRGAGTNFYKVLPEFTRLLPSGGDGRTPETAKVFMLLMTDGIGSRVFEYDRCEYNPRLRPNCYFEGSWRQDSEYVLESPFVNGSIRSQAFPASLCDEMKRKNVTVMTLATEFDSSNINDGHMKQVDSTLRTLSLNGLRGCASTPEMAYKANQAQEVDSAIRKMFAGVVEKARLTR